MKLAKIVSTTILTASIAFAATPATASLAQCTGNKTCFWGNNDYLWLIVNQNEGLPGAGLIGEANNEMDSWQNRSNNWTSKGTDNANGTGDCQTFGKGDKDNNVSTFNSDEVSYIRTNTGC